MKKTTPELAMRNVDSMAWNAVFCADVGALDVAMGQGADPNSVHPIASHTLLDQAVKSPTKASMLCATLLERGAQAPHIGEPLAFELAWRVIVEDSPILARQLMASGPEWSAYLASEKSKCAVDTNVATRMDTYMNAVSAFEAIHCFNKSMSSPQIPGTSMRMAR